MNVSASDRRVAVRLDATDAHTGVLPPVLRLQSRATGQQLDQCSSILVSGDLLNAAFGCTLTVPRGTAPGTLRVWSEHLADRAGNPMEVDANLFEVEVRYPASDDTTAPVVRSLEVSPSRVSGDEDMPRLTVRTRVTDNASGASAPTLVLSPGQDRVVRVFTDDQLGLMQVEQMTRISGTAQDGVYEWSGILKFHPVTNRGPWTAELFSLNDFAGNVTLASDSTVERFEVYSDSPVVGPGGATEISVEPGLRSAIVSWNAPRSNGGAPIVGYSISEATTGRTIAVGPEIREARFDDLPSGTEYQFVVEVVNAAGLLATSRPFAVRLEDAVLRLEGRDRYETAASTASRIESQGGGIVYIASGTTFPDALAGAALAAQDGAPILLSRRDSVPPPTLRALEGLQPSAIVLLGGVPTLGPEVAAQLSAYAPVSRIAGTDRYATSAAVARSMATNSDTVYVASGLNFPDALAGAAVAAAQGAPVLLTNPAYIPLSVDEVLRELDPARIVVLGGSPSVSDDVLSELRRHAPSTRIAGASRYETAALVAAELGDPERVYVASGLNFPDALAGAAVAGFEGVPVLLTRPDQLPDATLTVMRTLRSSQAVVLGNADAVSHNVARQLHSLIEP